MGCVVGPEFVTPLAPHLEQQYLNQQAHSNKAFQRADWWQVFGDPILNQLFATAMSQNLDVRASYERIVEARANLRLQGGAFLPNVDAITEYGFTRQSQNASPFVSRNGQAFDLFTLGLDSTWEIDLFGRISRTVEAADAEVQFQERDAQDIRQVLLAEIAGTYYRIRLLQQQISLTYESLNVQDQTIRLVDERTKAGVSTKLDLHQAQAFLHRTRAQLPILDQQLSVELNQLSILLGQSPSRNLLSYVGVQPLQSLFVLPDIGFPAELLRSRPDVRREEMAVAAAGARIGIAMSDLYPRLTLIGSIAVSSNTVSTLFDSNSLDFSVGPSVRWNILHFGRIQNNIDVFESLWRQATIEYQRTVLSAVREVEDGLARHRGFVSQWHALEGAIAADTEAVTLSLERYRAGKANFQRVLDAQQQLLQDRQLRASAQGQAAEQFVRVYKALGGGYSHANGSANFVSYDAGPTECGVPSFATEDGVCQQAPPMVTESPDESHSGSMRFSDSSVPVNGADNIPAGEPAMLPTGAPESAPTSIPSGFPRGIKSEFPPSSGILPYAESSVSQAPREVMVPLSLSFGR